MFMNSGSQQTQQPDAEHVFADVFEEVCRVTKVSVGEET